MAGNWGAILAGLAGGAGSLAQSMDKNEMEAQRRKERAEAAMRQLAIDSLSRQKTLGEMGAVEDTGAVTQGDMATGLLGSNLSIPTGIGTADAGIEGIARALGGAKQEEAGAQRFELPEFQGGSKKYRIDDQQTPEAKAMRRLTQQQQGQQRIEEFRTRSAESRAEAAQIAAEKRQREALEAAERRQAVSISASERRAGWSIQDDPNTGQKVRVNAITGETAPLNIGARGLGGAGGTGGVGGPRQTDAQKKANALLMMAQQAQEGLDGKEGSQTLAEAVEAPQDKKQRKLGDYTPSWLTQQGSRLPFGVGNYVAPEKLQQQQQYAMQLSDAWLRYTSGAAVPEQEVTRFAQTFIPQAGDTEAKKAQKKAARRMIIEAMRTGVGFSPTQIPLEQRYRLPFESATPSAPPDGMVNPYLVP